MKQLMLALLCLALAAAAQAAEHRSYKAKADFARVHPCPSTHAKTPHCPGYVIDHVKPLACGGADKPSNMQWQTIEAGKKKDAWERKGCKR